mmetsp:Transcript_46037/g.153626  ORF Transcript_46037/g.153626 Transcript_46037/m.153626 type:complete len:245 (+) Transcript_46037:374-1108(+)
MPSPSAVLCGALQRLAGRRLLGAKDHKGLGRERLPHRRAAAGGAATPLRNGEATHRLLRRAGSTPARQGGLAVGGSGASAPRASAAAAAAAWRVRGRGMGLRAGRRPNQPGGPGRDAACLLVQRARRPRADPRRPRARGGGARLPPPLAVGRPLARPARRAQPLPCRHAARQGDARVDCPPPAPPRRALGPRGAPPAPRAPLVGSRVRALRLDDAPPGRGRARRRPRAAVELARAPPRALGPPP